MIPKKPTKPLLMPVLDDVDDIDNNVEDDLYEDAIIPIDNDDFNEEKSITSIAQLDENVLKEKYKNPLQNETKEQEKEYIDKQKQQIIPYGGNKTKKIKSSDLDKRNNLNTKTKLFNSLIIIGFILFMIIGLYNTFIGNRGYTADEIAAIASQSDNTKGFPVDRGRAFVEDFMTEYLTIDYEDPSRLLALSYYYSGSSSQRALNINRQVSDKVKQHIVIEPTVYEIIPATSYSAQFKVSALVSNLDNSESYENGTLSTRWVTFSVNVYYDESTNALAIINDSPIAIPKYEIKDSSTVPLQRAFGNGIVNSDMLKVLTPTIDGYIKAYGIVSQDSWNEIAQYIKTNPAVELYSGFGGAMKLKDSVEISIRKTVYNTDVDGIYKIDTTVDWVDSLANANGQSIVYKSRYVMTIETTNDGKYLVTGFKPYIYEKN